MSALDLPALRALAREAAERASMPAAPGRRAINQEAFKQLIDEDIGWCKALPQTLERDHVVSVLQWSKSALYARETSDVPALATAVEQLCAALEEERRGHALAPPQRRDPREHTGATAVWCPICGDCSCPYVDDVEDNGRTFDHPLCPLHGTTTTHPTSDIAETCSACGEESEQLLTTGAAGSTSLCVRCYHTAAEEALRAHATDRAAWEAERAQLTKERDAARADVDRAIAERAQILTERIVVDRKAERYYVHWQGALMSSEANAATLRSVTEERNALDVRVEQLEAALADAKTTIERLTREALENDLVGAETMLSFVKGMPEEAEAKAYVAELRAKLGGSS